VLRTISPGHWSSPCQSADSPHATQDGPPEARGTRPSIQLAVQMNGLTRTTEGSSNPPVTTGGRRSAGHYRGQEVEFEREAMDSERALHEVEQATAARDRAVRAATETWEAALARAVALGESVDAVAAAAGVTMRAVRAIVR
jgi:hypothetical protein